MEELINIRFASCGRCSEIVNKYKEHNFQTFMVSVKNFKLLISNEKICVSVDVVFKDQILK